MNHSHRHPQHVLADVTEADVDAQEHDLKLMKARDYLRKGGIDRADPACRHVYTNANGLTIELEKEA